jgi:hypothetical protein
MRWPIDDKRDYDPNGSLFRVDLQRQVRERLALERRIAKRLGFACFADYYAARRAEGWGLDRLARETGQTRNWVRGVMRRYPSSSVGTKTAFSLLLRSRAAPGTYEHPKADRRDGDEAAEFGG